MKVRTALFGPFGEDFHYAYLDYIGDLPALTSGHDTIIR
jgi:hypothetical protein